MPKGRIILKSISDSQKLARCKTDGARLLYTWLIPHLDINGCFSADPTMIKGRVFTRLKKSARMIETYLDDLAENNLIILYEAKGDQFLHVPDFVEKQPRLYPDREAEGTIPLPSEKIIKAFNSRLTHDQLVSNSTSNINKSLNISLNKYIYTPEFEEFWNAYRETGEYVGNKWFAQKAWNTLIKKGVEVKLIARATNGYLDFLKDKRLKDKFPQQKMYATTFLRNDRWRDFIEYKSEPDL